MCYVRQIAIKTALFHCLHSLRQLIIGLTVLRAEWLECLTSFVGYAGNSFIFTQTIKSLTHSFIHSLWIAIVDFIRRGRVIAVHCVYSIVCMFSCRWLRHSHRHASMGQSWPQAWRKVMADYIPPELWAQRSVMSMGELYSNLLGAQRSAHFSSATCLLALKRKNGHGLGLGKLPNIWGFLLIFLQRPRSPLCRFWYFLYHW